MFEFESQNHQKEIKKILKRRNILAIITTIQRKNRISRADIAKITGLTPATVSKAIAELESFNIVRKVGQGESKGGRKPILIEFNPQSFYLSGIDLGITKVIAIVADLHGKIVSRVKQDINVRTDSDKILQFIYGALAQAFDLVGEKEKYISGIGLSVPGLIDIKRGLSIFAPNIPDWHNIPLVELFQKRFSLPVYIENDARAMALGEARFGAARGYENILCINVGHGIGGGLIVNGELYRGSSSAAGEIGHQTIIPTGPLCHCGNRGCLEIMASGYAIAASAIRVVNAGGNTIIRDIVDGKIDKITAEVVSKAALMGDVIAIKLIKEAGQYLGIGLANAINLFSPQIVIIGGGVALSGDILFDEVRNIINDRAFITMISRPEIIPSMLGENASVLGASALVLSNTISMGF